MKLPPAPVRHALRKLGSDIRDARTRRRISTTVMAQRAQMSRTTLREIERGEPAVSVGGYATVLFVPQEIVGNVVSICVTT